VPMKFEDDAFYVSHENTTLEEQDGRTDI
jgi:hypothetical protein